MKNLLAFILFFSINSYSQINDRRDRELDSIVTNIDKEILINLDSVHKYLHNIGRTDRERVFLYYGLIGAHYKYDKKRMWESSKKSIEYTPYYTAYKRSGVCRDFAALLKDLCDRSNIPSIVAHGKVKESFLRTLFTFVTLKYKHSNHAWNIVKYEDSWHLFDPTWTKVDSIGKYYKVDENGKEKCVAKVKRVNRDYFDAFYEEMYAKRKAEHPAYYSSSIVYSYKTVRRKKRKREVFYNEYNYDSILDSLSVNQFYKFSDEFNNESIIYSKNSSKVYNLNYLFSFLENKRTKFNPITIKECKSHLEQLEALLIYMELRNVPFYSIKYAQHMIKVSNYMFKLKTN